MPDRPIMIGAGELLWDCFPDGRRPGGAPANVAFHAEQLGLNGIVYSRVGQDAPGDDLLAFLDQHGLSTRYVQRDADHETGRVTVDLTNQEHPAFTIHENAAWDHLVLDPSTQALAAEASAICFGTLAQRSTASREALQGLLGAARPTCLLVYDVNLRAPWYQRSWLETSLDAAHVVKLNDDELGRVASLLELETAQPAGFAECLFRRFGVDLVCLTRGSQGCLLLGTTQQVTAPGISVAAADPVGAGDAFTAALILARLHGWSLPTTAQFANRIGALVASHAGAMPQLASEFQQVIREFAEPPGDAE